MLQKERIVTLGYLRKYQNLIIMKIHLSVALNIVTVA